jgi:hypothetical protein
MKKLLLVVVGLSAVMSGRAQGVIDFNNDNLKPPPNPRVRFSNGAGVVGTNFVAQLYYGAATSPESSLTPVADLPAHFDHPPTIRPGYWIGGMRTLDGFDPGNTVELQVRVWDITLAPTYEIAAQNRLGEFGAVSPFLYVIPPTGAPENECAMLNFQGYTLNAVPEPNVIPLTILGLAAVWLLRRRK